MDRVYYQLLDSCTEAVRLSSALMRNADYKEVIKAATDPFMVDCCKQVNRLLQNLQEVLNRQEYANVQSMPKCVTRQS